jgi:hypothetical protein
MKQRKRERWQNRIRMMSCLAHEYTFLQEKLGRKPTLEECRVNAHALIDQIFDDERGHGDYSEEPVVTGSV